MFKTPTKLRPVYKLKYTQLRITPFSLTMLEKIARCINVAEKLDESETKKDQILRLEKECVWFLGKSLEDWHHIIEVKYKNPELGSELLTCYRPIMHRNVTLLYSNMIKDALAVYENVDRFNFRCFFPKSFQDVDNYNTSMLKNRNAFIMNTSPISNSNNYGSHWVAFYVDVTRREVFEYFDPLGNYPSTSIQKSIDRILDKMAQVSKASECGRNVSCNSKRVQWGGTECGVFVVHYVARRLSGDSMNHIVKESGINDNTMKRMRNFYWSLQ